MSMGYCLLALIGCGTLLAQDGPVPEQDLVLDQIAPTPFISLYVPLTLGQNYAWSLHQMFDPGRLFVVAANAALDHSVNDPSAWGQGTEGYAVRVASRLGREVVRENIAFAVRAFDHEDPRYVRSSAAGIRRRAGYAAGRAFLARNERGETMPAYSLFVASLATPFIAQTWRPEPINAGRELRAGSMAIGLAASGNMYEEFWPDIRKKLRRATRP
jgi:hypothetical protein